MTKDLRRKAKVLAFDLECFKGETEILTDKGFIRFDRLKDEKVAQYHKDGSIDFVIPIQKIQKPYSGKFITFSKKRGAITVTENHEMVSKGSGSGVWKRWKAKNIPKTGDMLHSGQSSKIKPLTDMDRLAIALQADGHLIDMKKRRWGETLGYWSVVLRKERKIHRLLNLLESTGVRYSRYHYTRKNGSQDTVFRVYAPTNITKKFSSRFNFYECGEDFLQELSLWDGSRKEYENGYVQLAYNSNDFDNILFAQNVAIVNNRVATYCSNNGGYKLTFGKEKTMDLRHFEISEHQDSCQVYCVEVPTHMIIVKQGQQVLVTGNCSPNLGWFYGQYEVNPVKIENPPILLSVSWKWLGDKGRPKCLTINDCATVDPYDDSLLVRELWKLIDEAEIIVAHNLAFDEKMSNAFFLRHGLPAPSWYKGFCTLKTARRYFKLDNNKLDYLGKLLCGNTGKTAITHADVWYDMLHGNKQEKRKASDLMKEYNIVDVELLEKIYNRLLPFANNHPNMALAIGNEDVCPRCGFHADFKIKAYRKTQAGVNAIQYQCKHCHGYVTRKLTKEEREELSFHGKLTSTFRNTNY